MLIQRARRGGIQDTKHGIFSLRFCKSVSLALIVMQGIYFTQSRKAVLLNRLRYYNRI